MEHFVSVDNGEHESKLEKCFGIHLVNNTDEKILNLDLFNYHYKEQSKVGYKSFHSEYDSLLRQLAGLRKFDNLQITKIHFHAECDYPKFSIKQVNSKIELVWTSLDGCSYSLTNDLALFYSHEQVHKNIVILPFEKPITLSNQLQVKIEYLMPETEMTVSVFYVKATEEKILD